jgi:indole-3-pyruvate monooxygenase
LDLETVLIVGAGPAGLAVAACLHEAGIPSLILEQSDRVGSAWRQHYDRLHLHTSKSLSSLPFVPFPKAYPGYPSRQQVIEYLEAYARRFQISPRFGQRVVAAYYENSRWVVQTQDALYQAHNLVIASGYNREPNQPVWPGQASYKNKILHSSQYRNGEPFRGQKVLVVGFGNSGGEIAIDLWEHDADPGISVRGPVNVIPRELFGIPILALAILERRLPPRLVDAMNAPLLAVTVGNLKRYGLQPSGYGPLAQIQRQRRIPLIDVGTLKLIREGKVHIRPGVERFTEDRIYFTDGQMEKYEAVILATGYHARVDAFLDEAGVLDADGAPVTSGSEAALPGLYFCGFKVSPTGMLREIAWEARRIAAEIVRKARHVQS